MRCSSVLAAASVAPRRAALELGADDLLELAARAAFVLKVLSMMDLVSGGDATGRAGEFAMEAVEAVALDAPA